MGEKMRKAIPARKDKTSADRSGFSLVELVISMTIALIILGAGVTVFSSAMSTRTRESSKTDAITSAQAALNVMSREIGNSGYGLGDNGLGWYDNAGVWHTNCTNQLLRFRANTNNANGATSDPGEDVEFYLDGSSANRSVVRHDNNTGETSGIINRISSVSFVYHVTSTDGGVAAGPTVNIVTITLTVELDNAQGQPSGQTYPVTVSSNVTLRNSTTMRGQY